MLKLVTGAVLVVIALVVLVASSYAWFSMSSAPAVGGLQMNIGGGDTIKIAADMTVQTDSGLLHYPGPFSGSLNFSKGSSYGYLQDMVTLTPVSTADGVHWYFPAYYDSATGDQAGLQGTVADISDFLMDDRLTYANLSELPVDDAVCGSYAMVDFWVVSPRHARLRVSVGEGNGGSYLVGTPKPAVDENGDFVLQMDDGALAASARVGFLVNTQTVTDASMARYAATSSYNDHYRTLKGIYNEPGTPGNDIDTRFTIYEPNADFHRGNLAPTITSDGIIYRTCVNGSYIQTMPVGYSGGQATLVDVTDRTTAQTTTKWTMATGSERMIQQIFKGYVLGLRSPKLDTLYNGFYREYLGYQVGAYLEKGTFISKSEALGQALNRDGEIAPDIFSALNTAGATQDVIIVDLEKNVPQRIRMFVWIEGQDADCTYMSADSGLLMNLELAGSPY